MNTVPLAHIAIVKPVYEFLLENYLPAHRYLRAVNISPELVELGNGVIAKKQLYQLLNLVSGKEGLEDFGFRFGKGFLQNGMQNILQHVMQAVALKDAIDTFDALICCYMGEARAWLVEEGDHVWLCNTSYDGFQLQRNASSQCGILVLIDLVRLVAGPAWKPRRVKLEMVPPQTHSNVKELSQADILFDPKCDAVEFPIKFLGRPLLFAPKSSSIYSTPSELPKDFIPSLTIFLESLVVGGIDPALEVTAEAMGISSRSLQRYILDSGLTYRRLVDRARYKYACELLRDETITVKDISTTLGYSEACNFTRAFRRISGIGPWEFRNKQQTRLIN